MVDVEGSLLLPPGGAGLPGGAGGQIGGGLGGRAGYDSQQYRINVPQRIEPPKDLNAPARVDESLPKNSSQDTDASPAAPEADATLPTNAAAAAAKNLASVSVNKKQASVTKMKGRAPPRGVLFIIPRCRV